MSTLARSILAGVLAGIATGVAVLTVGVVLIVAVYGDSPQAPAGHIVPPMTPVVHIGPPQCEGTAGQGFCFIDLPDCTEYVTLADGDPATMTWYRQNWCTGETAAD